MTLYTILQCDDLGMWRQYGEKEASSPDRAVRAADPEEGVYVAVPKRSWKPMTVEVRQQKTVTVTAA